MQEDIQNRRRYTQGREENETKRKQGEWWVEAPKKRNEEKEENTTIRREENPYLTGVTYECRKRGRLSCRKRGRLKITATYGVRYCYS